MQNELIIIGAGGHAKVVADCARAMNQWQNIIFLDDYKKDAIADWKIAGSVSHLQNYDPNKSQIFIAIGDNHERMKMLQHAEELGFTVPTIIHPSAVISKNSSIGKGTVVLAAAVINIDATIGAGVIINTAAVIEHDCVIGDGVHISPNAALAGEVEIGNHSWVGINAAVIQQCKVGRGCMIAASAVVISDIPDDATAIGVPAKVR